MQFYLKPPLFGYEIVQIWWEVSKFPYQNWCLFELSSAVRPQQAEGVPQGLKTSQ
jgi:hypothetical protein